MKFILLVALATAHSLNRPANNKLVQHACDFIHDDGSEISTSLMPESLVQLESRIRTKDEDDTVEGARKKFAEMQYQMEQGIAAADAKRDEQSKQMMAQGDDPASQL